MTDPVISPDGKFMWIDDKWVPLPQSTAEDSPVTQSTAISDSVVTGDVNISQNVVADSRLCQQCSAGNVVLLKCTECSESFCELCNPQCHVVTGSKICDSVPLLTRLEKNWNSEILPSAPKDTWTRYDENKGSGPYCQSCKEIFKTERIDYFRIQNEEQKEKILREKANQYQIWNEKNKVLIDEHSLQIQKITNSDITWRVYHKLRTNNYISISDLLLNGGPLADEAEDDWHEDMDEEQEEIYLADLELEYTERMISKLPKETQVYLEQFNDLIQKKLSLLDQSQLRSFHRKDEIVSSLVGLGNVTFLGLILFGFYVLYKPILLG